MTMSSMIEWSTIACIRTTPRSPAPKSSGPTDVCGTVAPPMETWQSASAAGAVQSTVRLTDCEPFAGTSTSTPKTGFGRSRIPVKVATTSSCIEAGLTTWSSVVRACLPRNDASSGANCCSSSCPAESERSRPSDCDAGWTSGHPGGRHPGASIQPTSTFRPATATWLGSPPRVLAMVRRP